MSGGVLSGGLFVLEPQISGGIGSVNKTCQNRLCCSSMENILLTITHLIYNGLFLNLVK